MDIENKLVVMSGEREGEGAHKGKIVCTLLLYPYVLPPHSLSPLITTNLFSISMSLLFFCYIYQLVNFLQILHISDLSWYLSFSDISPRIILSKFIHVATNDKIFILFYCCIVLHCVHIQIYIYTHTHTHTPHFLPFSRLAFHIDRQRDRQTYTHTTSIHLLMGIYMASIFWQV